MEAEIIAVDSLPFICKLTVDGREICFESSAEIKTYMPPVIKFDNSALSYRPPAPAIYGLFVDGKPYLYTTAFEMNREEWHLEFPAEYLLPFSPCLG